MMKTALALAALVSMVTADCDISASHKTLSATCTFPGDTIDDACCAKAQAQVNTILGNLDVPPSQEDWVQCFGQPAPAKCTESVAGGGETGCTLDAAFPGFDVTCAIPKSTTISPACCAALQSTVEYKGDSLDQRFMSAGQQNCQSVIAWGQKRMGDLGPPPQAEAGGPAPLMSNDMVNYVSKALPAGLSCTEDKKETPSGLSHLILNAVLTVSGRKNVAELEAQPTASSPLIPMIAVAGAAGALGGLVAFVAVSKASSKSQRVPLISDDA